MEQNECQKTLKIDSESDLENICELIKLRKKSAFIIGFDHEGEAMKALPGANCKLKDLSDYKYEKNQIPAELIADLQKKGEELIEIKNTTILYVHGSPGCYIVLPSGDLVCICCY